MLVWGAGLLAYLVAVFHRSSLAVAGLAAAERFGISAAQLSTFAMLQLLVYAGLQVPVGLLIDRFGPRRVMLTGAVVMTLAQAGFAVADTFPLALVARGFVGLGDAMTFVCLLRLISTWFAPRTVPTVMLVTGPAGQCGAILAAIPMTWALAQLGWTRSYLLAAATGLVVTVAVALAVRDDPDQRAASGPALSWGQARHSLGTSWAQPGTRLGFWMHFTTCFSMNALGLLWGFPYFVLGQRTSEAFAGTLLTIMVLSLVVSGPLLGRAISLHPWHRSTIVLAVCAAIVLAWALVLVWPVPAPPWLLVVLVVVAGVGGPASMIGFDVGRSFNPLERLASATGLINQAGFVATLLLVVTIGVVLDVLTPGDSTAYTPEVFRVAMATQFVLFAVGMVQIWRYRGRTREVMVAEEPDRWPPQRARR